MPPRYSLFRFSFSVALSCAVLHFAAAAFAGQHGAGMREATYDDPWSGRKAPMTLWYPTDNPERPINRGPISVSVAPDAPVKGAALPLVVISHGWGGNMRGHIDTALALARAGFAVAAVQHVGNALDDNKLGDDARLWAVRPAQLAAGLDAALRELPVDPARIGAFGFSAGGYTVLALLGAQADPGRAEAHCVAHPEDESFCLQRPPGSFADAARADKVARPPDRRVRAAAVAAPVGALFPDGGLAAVDVPLRIYRAERDRRLAAVHPERVRDLATRRGGGGGPGYVAPEYVVVENAGHFSFLAPVAADWAARLGEIGQDPPGFDRAAFHQRFNAELTAFFSKTLQ